MGKEMEDVLDLLERYFEATMCGDWDKAFWGTDEFDALVKEVEDVLGYEYSVKDR